MKKTRLLALLMLLALVIPTFAACNNTDSGDGTVGDTSAESGIDPFYDPEIPEADFDGYKFTFFVGSNVTTCPHIFEATKTDDPVDEGIFRRNSEIENNYNIEIAEKYETKDSTAGAGAAYNAILASYEAQDVLYDAAVASAYDQLLYHAKPVEQSG